VDEQAIEEALARLRLTDPESARRATTIAQAYTFDPRPHDLRARKLLQRMEIVLGSGLRSQAMQTTDRPNSNLTPSEVADLADTEARNESTIGGGDTHLDVMELFRQSTQIIQQMNEVKVKNNPEEVAALLEKIREIRRQIKEADAEAVERDDGGSGTTVRGTRSNLAVFALNESSKLLADHNAQVSIRNRSLLDRLTKCMRGTQEHVTTDSTRRNQGDGERAQG
jgi:hypothetical protein